MHLSVVVVQVIKMHVLLVGMCTCVGGGGTDGRGSQTRYRLKRPRGAERITVYCAFGWGLVGWGGG